MMTYGDLSFRSARADNKNKSKKKPDKAQWRIAKFHTSADPCEALNLPLLSCLEVLKASAAVFTSPTKQQGCSHISTGEKSEMAPAANREAAR